MISVIRQSVTSIRDLPAETIPLVVQAYSDSLRAVYLLGIPTAIISSMLALLIKNISVLPPKAKVETKEVGVESA